MESRLFLSELHKAHEPENRKCLEIDGTVFRFMGSPDLQNRRRIVAMNLPVSRRFAPPRSMTA